MKVIHRNSLQKNSEIALVFDVETNGLLNPKQNIDYLPHILQLSYIMYDLKHKNVIKSVDAFIKVDKDVEISDEITAINGISHKKCEGGVPIITVLREFYNDYHFANILISHNYKFDSSMMEIEFQRQWSEMCVGYPFSLNLFNPYYMKNRNIDHYCTMIKSTDICKIPHKSSIKSNNSYKWPTLQELHFKLFGKNFSGAHNSMIDVMSTLRCHLQLNYNIFITDNEIETMCNNFKI